MNRTPPREVIVPESLAGERLDRALAALSPGISRGEARRLIAAGVVFVDDKRTGIQSRVVRAGERLSWNAPIVAASRPVGVEPRIIVERPELWIVDKPAGMPVEATRQGNQGTLHAWLVDRFGAAFVTHRLDTATSGLIVVARDRATQAALNALFAAHTVTRRYIAVVSPPPPSSPAEIRIDAPLDGKIAVTHARVAARSATAAVLVARLATGRTRQIRRHFAGAGFPVVGETLSGERTGQRLLLHAFELGVPASSASTRTTDSTAGAITATVAPPADFLAAAAELGLPGDVFAAAVGAVTPAPLGDQPVP